MSSLYKGGLFLSSREALAISAAGWHFLACYGRLAKLTYMAGNPKFTLIPKAHMMWHVVFSMHSEGLKQLWICNPMSESCSVEEDVIGRFCFLTRKVSPRMRVLRSLQRYLTQVAILWRR